MSRQNYSPREFNSSNRPGTCLFCGKKIGPDGGVRGEGYFCSLVDAVEFATIAAVKGIRYVRGFEAEGSR